jgi:ribosomal protein S18 acetylase RimI-like enzyme
VNVFRLSSRADPAFLAEMLYEAVNWRDDGAEERPPFDDLLNNPEVRRYVEDWGRKGDVAIVALDRLEEPVGAAWYRHFSSDEPGYGFVAPDVPELSIGVYPECRGQHVGSLLLGTLVNRARTDGHRAISLSVAAANPARRLYERYGFEPAPASNGQVSGAGDADTSLTLVLDLS